MVDGIEQGGAAKMGVSGGAPGSVAIDRPDSRKAAQLADIDNRFSYHAPKNDQSIRYGFVRDGFRDLAKAIVANTPISREQSTALTLLDQAMMMSNAAIARNE